MNREAISLDGTPKGIIGEVWRGERDGYWRARRGVGTYYTDTRDRAIAWLVKRYEARERYYREFSDEPAQEGQG